ACRRRARGCRGGLERRQALFELLHFRGARGLLGLHALEFRAQHLDAVRSFGRGGRRRERERQNCGEDVCHRERTTTVPASLSWKPCFFASMPTQISPRKSGMI